MIRIHIKTLGCRLNQAESEAVAHGFCRLGYTLTKDPQQADLIVLNSCTVTTRAGLDSIKQARHRPDQKLVVTGCHSEVEPTAFGDGVLMVASGDKESLPQLVQDWLGDNRDDLHRGADNNKKIPLYPLQLGQTRAFVKIQDGCSLACTYCMTTLARGEPHSRPLPDIVAEVQTLSEQGCWEVVLTGVHAASYGREQPDHPDLGALIETLLNKSNIARIRLSSLEPWNLDPTWFALWQQYPNRLCNHFHMSLQSGSDTVLARMKRAYDSQKFVDKIAEARSAIPGLAITTDLICGFPGETEQEHRTSMAFVQRMGFAGAHIFTFSARPGTVAADLPEQLPEHEKKRRRREMLTVTHATAEAFRRSQIDTRQQVLWLKTHNGRNLEGLTGNYLKVVATPQQIIDNGWEPNTLATVELAEVRGEVLGVG